MDESKHFEEAIAKYTLDYGPTSATSTHGYTHGYRDGAEAQQQVGPCGKHPRSCYQEVCLGCGRSDDCGCPAGTGLICTVCASEQELRAEIAARDATIEEMRNYIGDRQRLIEHKNFLLSQRYQILAAREAELTTLRDKLRKQEKVWIHQSRQSSVNAKGRRACANELAALLAEEAGR